MLLKDYKFRPHEQIMLLWFNDDGLLLNSLVEKKDIHTDFFEKEIMEIDDTDEYKYKEVWIR